MKNNKILDKKIYINQFQILGVTLILLTLNITKVILFTEGIKFNIALSDVFIPFFFIGFCINFINTKNFKNYKGLIFWFLLLSWIIFVGVLAIKSEFIIDEGWTGLVKELIKTGLVILYFFIGYFTPKCISRNRILFFWSISICFFILGGILIYTLANKGIFYWSDDPKYLRMFMGMDTDPNHAATFLTLSFFAMGGAALFQKRQLGKIWFSSMMGLTIFGLVFTGSRGGLIGFSFGLLILFAYYLKKNRYLAMSIFCILIMMTLIFIMIDNIYFEGDFASRVIYKFQDFKTGFDTRFSLGKSAFLMGVDHPIFGVGRGNYSLNSKPYFIQIGGDFLETIPHNTYFGIFAEVGIIGLILFMMPIWLIFLTWYKRYRGKHELFKSEIEIIYWILSGLIAIGIQAFVLNVENRRFLWYLAGVLICWFEQNQTFQLNKTSIPQTKWRQILLSLIFFIVIAYSFISQRAYISLNPKTIFIDNKNYRYEIPTKVINFGELNELGINVVLPLNEEKTERLTINLIELNENNEKTILWSKTYAGVLGQLFIPFIPSNEAKQIYLEMYRKDLNLDSFIFKPVSIISNNKVYILEQWYFLLPPKIAVNSIVNNSVDYETYTPVTSLKEEKTVLFSNILKLEEVSHEINSGKHQVIIKYKVLKDLRDDLMFLLLGYPYNLEMHDENTIRYGYELFETAEEIKSSTWKQGETHEVRFIVPKEFGIYSLKAGIRVLKENEWFTIHINEGEEMQKDYTDLGWLNLN